MKKSKDCISEINITPLVDVFLVLLSIFIVLSMLYYNSHQHVLKKISVPKTNTDKNIVKEKYNYTNVFLHKDLTINIGKSKKMTFEEFSKNIKELKNKKINLIADENLKYKYIIKMMDLFNNNDILDINIELISIVK